MDSFRERYLLAEQAYRHEVGRSAVKMANRAQTLAFIIAVLFLAAGTAAVLTRHDVAGASIAVTASVSLATAFLTGMSRMNARAEHGSEPIEEKDAVVEAAD